MNREILFEYGFKSVNGIVKKQYGLHDISNIKEKCDVWYELPLVYVRQYTGKEDRNGVKIFEGDIDQDGAIAMFYNNAFQMCSVKNGEVVQAIPFWCFDDDMYPQIEIVGNIHENQE